MYSPVARAAIQKHKNTDVAIPESESGIFCCFLFAKRVQVMRFSFNSTLSCSFSQQANNPGQSRAEPSNRGVLYFSRSSKDVMLHFGCCKSLVISLCHAQGGDS